MIRIWHLSHFCEVSCVPRSLEHQPDPSKRSATQQLTKIPRGNVFPTVMQGGKYLIKITIAYHVGEGMACLQRVLAYRKRNLPCRKAGLCLLLILSIVWAPSVGHHSHQVYGSDVRKQLLTAHDSQQSAGRPPGRCALENAICSHLTLECSWQAISVPARSVVGPRA